MQASDVDGLETPPDDVKMAASSGNSFPISVAPSLSDRLKRIDDFMRENLNSPISLSEIAEEAGVSRFHLIRVFKRTHGETPFKRLTRLRMEEAQRRLLHSRESVTEIALTCGYGNPTHFASAFRRFAGVSPTSYREKAR
jgi:AraC family transcriptional regulator